jgi:hypothetical protein
MVPASRRHTVLRPRTTRTVQPPRGCASASILAAVYAPASAFFRACHRYQLTYHFLSALRPN